MLFPDQPVSTPGDARIATLLNNGQITAHIAAPRTEGTNATDFEITTTTCQGDLPAGESCDTAVTFSPSAEGTREASLAIEVDGAGVTHLPLTGAGSAPTGLIVDPTTLDFPEQPLRTPSPPLTVAVTHPSPGTTTLDHIVVEGAAAPQFTLVNDTCTDHQIPTAGSCTVDVQFTPDTPGPQTASLQFVADDGSVAASLPLRGASAPPPATRPALPPTHREVAVPSVVGKPIETARALLTAAGLGVGDIDEQPNDSAPAGRVIRSGPAPGTRVDPGTVVALITSSGPPTCIVPDVTGQGLETAKANLEATCAEVGAVTTKLTVGEGPTGVVTRTSPEPGARINKGDAVQLVVSKDGTRVPDVEGMALSEAEAAIKANGLKMGAVAEADGIEVPVVIKSSPGQGKIMELGGAVDLTLGEDAPEESDGEQQGSGG